MNVSRILLLSGVVALLWGEYENWRSSHTLVGSPAGTEEVIVVLGCRNSGSKANILNRWRVRAGLRSRGRNMAGSRIVFCGGAVGGPISEAELMAEYAHTCGYRGPVVLETGSRTTWENIEAVIPLIEDADPIKIVSNPMHAEQARSYLVRMRPDLAVRLARGADYRFGEWMIAKPVFAVFGRRRRATGRHRRKGPFAQPGGPARGVRVGDVGRRASVFPSST
ncbi:YdcF family protein [Nocardia sp. NPDC051750]|uniref:YdcF family protein n=1 Tax=Nocardia sp. NPDC051750 TaxID=3364325 RepID=UPI0037932811